MGGLVLDIFLVRWIVNYWRNVVSRQWPVASGTVVRCHFETHGFAGDYVVLHYKYKVDWERFHGVVDKPYIYPNYAEAFVRHHPADSELRIRVHPKDRTQSFPVLD
jgi:hypothetical protein